MFYRDGDDDDQPNGNGTPTNPDDTNQLPDDIGERIGQGHDPVEDEIL